MSDSILLELQNRQGRLKRTMAEIRDHANDFDAQAIDCLDSVIAQHNTVAEEIRRRKETLRGQN